MELFSGIKMDLLLNNPQSWFAIKPKQTNKQYSYSSFQCFDMAVYLTDMKW